MPLVNITAHVRDIIRARADRDWRETGIRRPDGTWDIPLAYDTLELLNERALSGESISDTIERVLSTQRGTN